MIKVRQCLAVFALVTLAVVEGRIKDRKKDRTICGRVLLALLRSGE